MSKLIKLFCITTFFTVVFVPSGFSKKDSIGKGSATSTLSEAESGISKIKSLRLDQIAAREAILVEKYIDEATKISQISRGKVNWAAVYYNAKKALAYIKLIYIYDQVNQKEKEIKELQEKFSQLKKDLN